MGAQSSVISLHSDSGGSLSKVALNGSVSLSQPVIAENSLQATASLSNIPDKSFTRESKIAISIKNLHSLTITDRLKGSCKSDKLPQDQEISSSQGSGPKKSPRSGSFRKNAKKEASSTESNANSKAVNPQDSALPISDNQASLSNKQTSVRDKPTSISDKQTFVSVKKISIEEGETGDTADNNVPKFFKSDMMSIIAERNELKEKVMQLNDKIEDLER